MPLPTQGELLCAEPAGRGGALSPDREGRYDLPGRRGAPNGRGAAGGRDRPECHAGWKADSRVGPGPGGADLLRPGGAQASPERAEPGEWARLYGIPVTQIDLYPFQPLDAVGIAYRPGLRTLKNLLSAALCPVGRTLYVYGGGWNWQDDRASCQAVSAGVPECWGRFFQSQGTDYTYRDDSHPGQSWYPCGGVNRYYYAGADCSGYLGWVVYQVMHSRSGGPGYVVPSTGMARHLAEHLGLGTWCHRGKAGEFRPGDIFSMSGHVWMCLGPCGDGSLVILHSTPSLSRTGCPGGGVQLSGVGKRPDCQAAVLARRYMTAFYPDWTRRYEPTWKPVKEYTALAGADTGRFSWYLGPNGLADPEGCAHRGGRRSCWPTSMGAEQSK